MLLFILIILHIPYSISSVQAENRNEGRCSASTVCAFLMKRHGLSMDAALALVRSARPIANPNVGFIGMLQSL